MSIVIMHKHAPTSLCNLPVDKPYYLWYTSIIKREKYISTFTKKEEVKDMMKLVVTIMVSIMTMMGAHTVETATVVETYDDTMLVEMHDGNIHEYTFDNMTEEEMYATTVVLVNGEVVAVR